MKKYSSYFVVISILVSLIIALYVYQQKRQSISINTDKFLTEEMGGSFSLIDHNMKSVTDKDYLGQYLVMYFGFGRCKSICPTHLSMLSFALDNLNKKNVLGLFVSLDSTHDTPDFLNEYRKLYSERITMLTGNTEQAKQIKTKFKVYAENTNDDEIMNHSTLFYIIKPNGKYLTHVFATDENDLLSQLHKIIK